MTTSNIFTRGILALAMVAVLGIGAASASEFGQSAGTYWNNSGQSIEMTNMHKYRSDHGGAGPEARMPFMPGSD